MDITQNVHGYMICWKNILRNPPTGYLPFVLGYIQVSLAPPFFLGAVFALDNCRILYKNFTYNFTYEYNISYVNCFNSICEMKIAYVKLIVINESSIS